MAVLATALVFACFLALVSGHGLMQDPPHRSNLWRHFPSMGFEKNYNDNELFCGGFSRQWNNNDGKCGTCGDAYDGFREHEAGGKFATGFISRRYKQGQDIEVEIKLTANHLGFFEFKLCPWNDVTTPVTQECMDKHVLHLAGQPGITRYLPGSRNGLHYVKLTLPVEITCEQCVLQWHYKAGNNHNCDKHTGECCKGCGAQETFVNCADIAIDRDPNVTIPPTTEKPSTTQAPTTVKPTTLALKTEESMTQAPTTAKPWTQASTTPKPTTQAPTTSKPTTQAPTSPKLTTQAPTTPKPATQEPTTPKPTTQEPTTSKPHVLTCASNEVIDCLGVGIFEGIGYEGWCRTYCQSGSTACSPTLCQCTCKRKVTCYGIEDFKTLPGIDQWCTDTCQYGCDDLQDMCGCTVLQ